MNANPNKPLDRINQSTAWEAKPPVQKRREIAHWKKLVARDIRVWQGVFAPHRQNGYVHGWTREECLRGLKPHAVLA